MEHRPPFGGDDHRAADLLRGFAFVNDAPPAPQAMLIDDVLPLEGLYAARGRTDSEVRVAR